MGAGPVPEVPDFRHVHCLFINPEAVLRPQSYFTQLWGILTADTRPLRLRRGLERIPEGLFAGRIEQFCQIVSDSDRSLRRATKENMSEGHTGQLTI